MFRAALSVLYNFYLLTALHRGQRRTESITNHLQRKHQMLSIIGKRAYFLLIILRVKPWKGKGDSIHGQKYHRSFIM